MEQKKLMILGGGAFIIPLIQKAKQMGIFVITCDYLPNNIAHKFSDQYVNVSIIDKKKVLKVAKELKIDGICSFACDPGVVTAAYVAEKIGLPNVGPYKSVRILQDKALFRAFLKKNGFNVPWFKEYHSAEEALTDSQNLTYPLIIKPTDSAGSKGVTKLTDCTKLKEAIEKAFDFSLAKSIIIEEFLEKSGHQSSADCFSINGKLVFAPFTDQLFDLNASNVYNPCGTVTLSSMPSICQKELTSELQRLIKLLNMNTSIYNVESRLATNGKTYLMEVSPRGGGNRIAEIESIAYEQDLLRMVVESCLGMPIYSKAFSFKKYCMTYVLHSAKDGVFKELFISDDIKKNILWMDLHVKNGDKVESFSGSNKSFGTVFLSFSNEGELYHYRDNIDKHINVVLKDE